MDELDDCVVMGGKKRLSTPRLQSKVAHYMGWTRRGFSSKIIYIYIYVCVCVRNAHTWMHLGKNMRASFNAAVTTGTEGSNAVAAANLARVKASKHST